MGSPRLSILFTFTVFLYGCVAPPVTKNKEQPDEQPDSNGLDMYMEYHRYLQEVVNALESDPTFKKKLENATEEDIRSGKIAHELEFVNHHVRSQLDEIKRVELERLRELTEKRQELSENSIVDDPTHHHLDKDNPHTFEISDLKKLIAKTTEDLAEADRKRREEFKQYELQKEYEKVDKLNHTTGEEREKLEKEYKEMEEKHKKHEKLHEPGHKQQLEEVWEEQDEMQQHFDPKTFFMLHDTDSNGLWDETEVKALFIKELDKMYSAGAPEDDMRERVEEMERMRESVFRDMDVNKDGFIAIDEFIEFTNKGAYQQDHGWQGIDEQKPYSDEELEAYIREHQAQQAYYQQNMGAPGQMPHPGPGYQMPPPQGVPHPQMVQQQQYQQVHPGQYQQQVGGHVPPGAYQGYQGQAPPGANQNNQINQGQVPPGAYQNSQGHVQPGAYQQGEVPPGAYQNNQGQVQQGGYQVPPNYQAPQNQFNQPMNNAQQVNTADVKLNQINPSNVQQQQQQQQPVLQNNAVPPQPQANIQYQQPNQNQQPVISNNMNKETH